MPFAEEPKLRSTSETRKRSASDYVKFDEEYRTTLRVLNPNARTVWRHWIPAANGGRGMSANCPNISAQTNVCPIELSAVHLPKDSDEYRESRARRRYVVNVLDRTPYTTCTACGTETPGKRCTSCRTDLSKADFKPLNRVKILEGGPQLFTQALNPIERMQKDDLNLEITDYDIKFTTSGKGRDRKIAALPAEAGPLDLSKILDESGEPVKLFDLDIICEPNTVEDIQMMLEGATLDEILAVRA